MNSVPYIMLITSKAQGCGWLRTYLEKTSQLIMSVNEKISHANNCPTQVLILSIVKRMFCIFLLKKNQPLTSWRVADSNLNES